MLLYLSRKTAAAALLCYGLLPVQAQQTDQAAALAKSREVLIEASAYRGAKSLDAFFTALRHMESGGDYGSVNTLNFIGAYQFGEAALIDLGYVRLDRNIYDNDYGGGFTGKDGIHSIADFLNNPRVQEKAMRSWIKLMWRYIEGENLDRYAWTRVGEVVLTPSGMLGATHLLGTGGLKDFIESGGSRRIVDPYGTPVLKYVSQLTGYEIPFAPGRPARLATLN
jgi:hypothetical protein